MRCKNSTLLDTSKAVSIEKVPQFSNLSAILGMPSEDYQKCHREIVMMLADQSTSPKPKSTSHSESGFKYYLFLSSWNGNTIKSQRTSA